MSSEKNAYLNRILKITLSLIVSGRRSDNEGMPCL